jgi:hypothetical protein
MSNKSWDKINELDKLLRKTVSTGPGQINGAILKIEMIHGFELFNTRPYHNYETWSIGYRVSGFNIVVEREDLDDAIKDWCNKYAKI